MWIFFKGRKILYLLKDKVQKYIREDHFHCPPEHIYVYSIDEFFLRTNRGFIFIDASKLQLVLVRLYNNRIFSEQILRTEFLAVAQILEEMMEPFERARTKLADL